MCIPYYMITMLSNHVVSLCITLPIIYTYQLTHTHPLAPTPEYVKVYFLSIFPSFESNTEYIGIAIRNEFGQ